MHTCSINYICVPLLHRRWESLEFYKGHSPPASGVHQAPHFTYSHSAASTIHTRCLSSTTHTHIHIANMYAKCSKHSQHQVPVKHHNIPLLHIDRSREGVIVTNNLQWHPMPHSPSDTLGKIYLLHLLLHMQHLPCTHPLNLPQSKQANGMTRDHRTTLSTHDVYKDGECHRQSNH